MSLQVVWTKRAQRDMRRLDPDIARRIGEAIDTLAETGMGDVKPLKGAFQGELRLRVGDWRVFFRPAEEAGDIQVLRILPRGQAYRVREEADAEYAVDAR